MNFKTEDFLACYKQESFFLLLSQLWLEEHHIKYSFASDSYIIKGLDLLEINTIVKKTEHEWLCMLLPFIAGKRRRIQDLANFYFS